MKAAHARCVKFNEGVRARRRVVMAAVLRFFEIRHLSPPGRHFERYKFVAKAFGETLCQNKQERLAQLERLLRTAGDASLKPISGPDALQARRSDFYDSDEWRHVRYRALKLHGGACQCCGNRASTGKPLHVDHIKPRSKFPELELDLNNLQVLCKDCNLGKRAWDQTDWRPSAQAAE